MCESNLTFESGDKNICLQDRWQYSNYWTGCCEGLLRWCLSTTHSVGSSSRPACSCRTLGGLWTVCWVLSSPQFLPSCCVRTGQVSQKKPLFLTWSSNRLHSLAFTLSYFPSFPLMLTALVTFHIGMQYQQVYMVTMEPWLAYWWLSSLPTEAGTGGFYCQISSCLWCGKCLETFSGN